MGICKRRKKVARSHPAHARGHFQLGFKYASQGSAGMSCPQEFQLQASKRLPDRVGIRSLPCPSADSEVATRCSANPGVARISGLSRAASPSGRRRWAAIYANLNATLGSPCNHFLNYFHITAMIGSASIPFVRSVFRAHWHTNMTEMPTVSQNSLATF